MTLLRSRRSPASEDLKRISGAWKIGPNAREGEVASCRFEVCSGVDSVEKDGCCDAEISVIQSV